MPLDDLKAAARDLGASINDLFLAGLTEGAVRYHADRGVEVDAFNTSFVLSTRTDSAVGGNSFTPVPVQVPGAPMPLAERVDDIRERLAASREAMSSGGGMGAVSGIANLLPTSVVTQAARAAAGRIDFATSNLARGAVHALRRRGACLQHRHDGSRGRHRVQRDRVVVRRAIRHRSVHRSRRDRCADGLPRCGRVVVRRPGRRRPRRRPGDEVRRHRRDLPRPARRHHRRPGRDRRHRLVASAMRSNRSRRRAGGRRRPVRASTRSASISSLATCGVVRLRSVPRRRRSSRPRSACSSPA